MLKAVPLAAKLSILPTLRAACAQTTAGRLLLSPATQPVGPQRQSVSPTITDLTEVTAVAGTSLYVGAAAEAGVEVAALTRTRAVLKEAITARNLFMGRVFQLGCESLLNILGIKLQLKMHFFFALL